MLQVVVQTTVIKRHCSKVSRNLFAGGGSRLQLVKNATSAKHVQRSTVEQGMPVGAFRYRAESVLSSPALTDLLAEWSLHACTYRCVRVCAHTHTQSTPDQCGVRGTDLPHSGNRL